MYLLTPEKQYKVELVAGILARADSSFYDFPVPEDRREAVVQGWLEDSTFETRAEIQPDDRFVTLSTCSYEFSDARYVVIGVLREIEQ
jgi:sortase B